VVFIYVDTSFIAKSRRHKMDLAKIVAELKTEQERIGRAIAALLDGAGVVRRGRPPKATPKPKGGGMSPEGRRRIALAMKRRWAEHRARMAAPNPANAKAATPKKRGGGLTAAGSKKLSEAMKKRWAEKKMKRS
jgi:hypothetical protein